jgi:lysophospholipase
MNPALDEKFLAPAGWITHSFTNDATGHKVHYGRVYPKGKPPSAVIVCLGGLSEFSEKYFETAHDMLARGFAFWIMDWQYQGRSGRLAKYPQRRHSDGFDSDISDLAKFVDDYILPAAVHPDVGRIPLIMLGHSMGGNIGLRYLTKFPKRFDGAAFTAPFLGIYNFSVAMKMFVACLTPFIPFIGKNYVPGGTDWQEAFRKSDGKGIFSSDTVRDTIHNLWSKHDAALQVGQPTLGWVSQALKSCALLKRKGALENILIPVLIAAAGKEEIVDNDCIRAAASRLPKGEFLEIEGARHEILMEADAYRNTFFKAFDKMVEQHKIATIDNVKPF